MYACKPIVPGCIRVLGALLAGAALSLAASAPRELDLPALKKIYETNLAKIVADGEAAVESAKANYARDIQNLANTLQKAGHFEGWQAASKELERYRAEQTIPDPPKHGTPVEILQAQRKYRDGDERSRSDKNAKVLALTEQYVARLTDMRKRLTVAGDMDEAAKFNAEIVRVKASPAVTAAEFAAAATAAKASAQDDPVPAALPGKPGGETVSGNAPAVHGGEDAPGTGLRKGLVLYYAFDRNERTKIADKSGEGNDGVAKGAAWTADGRSGGGLQFNGGGDRIEVRDSRSLRIGAADLSVAVWLRFGAQVGFSQHSYAAVFLKAGKRHPWPGPSLFVDYPTSGHACFRVDGTQELISRNRNLGDSVWHHFVGVRQGGEIRLYVDGQLDTSRPIDSGDVSTPEHVVIGANQTDRNAQCYGGLMDELRVYDRALTADEVRQLASEGSAKGAAK